MTRAVCAAAHGRIFEALKMHAFGPIALLGALAVWFALLFNLKVRWDHPWIPRLLMGGVAGLMVYWVVRIFLKAVP